MTCVHMIFNMTHLKYLLFVICIINKIMKEMGDSKINNVRFNFSRKKLFFSLGASVLEIYIERVNKGKGYVASNSTFSQSCDRSSPGTSGPEHPGFFRKYPAV